MANMRTNTAGSSPRESASLVSVSHSVGVKRIECGSRDSIGTGGLRSGAGMSGPLGLKAAREEHGPLSGTEGPAPPSPDAPRRSGKGGIEARVVAGQEHPDLLVAHLVPPDAG